MSGTILYQHPRITANRPAQDVMPLYTCISKQFRTFCKKLYYFSNFKDFNTLALNRLS
ncbi:hypothetical protein [Chitinophaga barathri]|uniref:hypothetical protein n=1 Tax=Chitinophaga barathri TaxID=1647451 RepID=UPI0013C3F5FE|nr:hypothetical protein [Chitinophaga barathri]